MQDNQLHKDHIEYSCTMEHFSRIMEWVQKKAKEAKCVFSDQHKIELAMEEALVNVIRYAYPQREGRIEVFCSYKPKIQIQFTIIDSGFPFNPLEHHSNLQNTQEDLTMRVEGGLGIAIIKEAMDEIFYERRSSKNMLTLIKKIDSGDS